MNHSFLDEFSENLIREAENECADSDPGMTEAAAMVYVGDVYALRLCHSEEAVRDEGQDDSAPTDDGVSPFIR